MLEISGLSKDFGGFRAVNDCSFTVAKGSITGLIGPNGAGKTTTFDLIAGALRPTAGQVLFLDRDITTQPAHARFHSGLVRTFQIPREFHRLTVVENLMVACPEQPGERLWANWLAGAKVRRTETQVREQAMEALEFLGLTHLAEERAGNLSGGQKKLLELGRTMMVDARVVLLDEVGAGVNRTLLRRITESILRLNLERGYTFCMIEHDMDFISMLCDPVIVMVEGRVLTEGPADRIMADEAVIEAYLGRRPAGPP